ncbi:IS30 family transposase [Candidatus Nitrotoga fabula]|uniref:Integrase catalytic domain-containing protein n=1 Tax=Candidatus Nitrotoga fabula TaxID=2182327 RepID=A0A916BBR9_9PROT|nr:IS30 family transposase [Candidatus Nitrotoga fabula]CAE6703812.1 hypothetical protein NTGZN8_160062 [Candidatus Nitrotoga fabula]
MSLETLAQKLIRALTTEWFFYTSEITLKGITIQKKRRKSYGKTDRRSIITNRQPIEQRPAIVDARSRIGDWEADTIIGQNYRQTIVSLGKRKTAKTVTKTTTSLLNPHQRRVHTITSDDERKFAEHKEINNQLDTDFYFAHPYASWERGTNENTNGLIRQYFPKNRDFTTITQQKMGAAMERLNNQPRKRLGYQTPNQVFFKSGVALHI